jgi:mono/diheme cytochrome c family protein
MRRIAVAAVIVALSGSAGIVATAAGSPSALTPSTATGQQEPDGKAIYLANCKQCHGVLGEPTKAAMRKYDKIASFRGEAFFASRSDDSLRAVVRNGAGRDMKPFKEKLSAAEIEAVVKYIHTLAKHEKD